MLKIVADGSKAGKNMQFVVLGFSHANLERLKNGKPIIFSGEDVKIPGVEFIIFSGETEQSMARDFSDLVGPNTETKLDPRTTDA